MAKILIADDEANLRKVLSALLEKDGHETIAVSNGLEALERIQTNDIDILITDFQMPEMNGLELLERVKPIDSSLPVLVITAHGTIDTAVTALKKGAFDYITKPFDRDELRIAVRKAAALRTREGGRSDRRYHIVGRSSRMKEIYQIIEKVAATPSTVLITGESGTGKELVATALHDNSSRKDKAFIKVNCAAIPKELIESEFFGYEKGAFTGAVNSKPGRFELADGGTLFLDEIGEIPSNIQVKLLRALQESEFERVGGIRTIKVDVRLIAATNRNLAREVAEGTFREDLYYRLNVVPIALPALRERIDDIDLLAAAFMDKYNERLNKEIESISPPALAMLKSYQWPGNIRELENAIERALLFCETPSLGIQDLPEPIRASAPAAEVLATNPPSTDSLRDQARTDIENGQTSMKDIVRRATVELERDLILKALDETQGNITRAAHLLGISRKGLQNKMRDFGLRDPNPKE